METKTPDQTPSPVTAPSVNGMKKREQIQHTNKLVFLWVAAAAVAVTIALILSQFLFRQFMFNSKVIGELSNTNQTLKDNNAAYTTLKSEVVKLLANQQLNNLRVNKDAGGDNALQVIIDAMPTTDDRLALAASLQQSVLSKSGVTIDQLTFTDGDASMSAPVAATASGTAGSVTEIPFSFKASGTYDQLKKMFSDIQLSIRPISLSSVKLSGKSDAMSAEVQATTFYATPATTDLTTKEVKP